MDSAGLDRVGEREARLAEAEELLDAIHMGEIDAVSSATRTNAGSSRSKARPMIWTPDDRAAGAPEEEMSQTLSRGRAEDERFHLHKNGSRFWAAGLMVPLRAEDGPVIGFFKILRDRTVERARSEEALRHSQKLEAIGQLTAASRTISTICRPSSIRRSICSTAAKCPRTQAPLYRRDRRHHRHAGRDGGSVDRHRHRDPRLDLLRSGGRRPVRHRAAQHGGRRARRDGWRG